MKADKMTLASLLADEIANGYNQHRIMFIEGKTGTGKSNAAIDLAHKTSIEFSKRLGGLPEDYFTIDNVAIITEKELIRVGETFKKFGIYILDDIGIGFSAREWNTKGNKIIGYILQTFRTYNNLLIMTAPDREFIDKIGRNLLHYKVLMTGALFEHGVSYGSVSRVVKKYQKDNGGNMYPFIRRERTIFTSVKFQRAPDNLINEYEKRRFEIQDTMQKEKLAELKDMLFDEAEKQPKVTVKDRVQELRRDTLAGLYPSLKAACDDNGISYKYAKTIPANF